MIKPVIKKSKKKLTDDLPSTRPYLIESILPAYEVHLVGGPSGAGKSRWLMQVIDRWRQGESIFGYASHPVPFVYVATDRSYASVCETLRDMGLDPTSVPILPALDIEPEAVGYSVNWLFKQIDEYHPDAKLLIIEAIGTLVPGGKIGDYDTVAKFLRTLSRKCRKRKITIIGIHHTAKEKDKGGYGSDREKLMGSGGWSGFSETLFMVLPMRSSDANSPFRRVTILPRNGAGIFLNFKFDKSSGRLQELSRAEAALAGMTGTPRRGKVQHQLREYFAGLTSPEFSLKEVLSSVPGTSRRTVIYQIEEWCREGVLQKKAHGIYSIVGRVATSIFEGNLL